MSNLFSGPLFPADLQAQITDRYAMFAGVRMEGDGGGDGGDGSGDTGSTGDGKAGQSGKSEDQTFTQADIDRVVADRLKREREATKAKYADYENLKKAAEGKKSAEDRIADLQKEIEATKHEALKRRVQAAHGISDEDAELFLTGADEEALTAQAKRLTERESERRKQGNRVPGEGRNHAAKADDERAAVRELFGNGG